MLYNYGEDFLPEDDITIDDLREIIKELPGHLPIGILDYFNQFCGIKKSDIRVVYYANKTFLEIVSPWIGEEPE